MKKQLIRIGVIDPLTGDNVIDPSIDDSGPVIYQDDPAYTDPKIPNYSPPATDEPTVYTTTDPGASTTENKINWTLLIAVALGFYLISKK